MSLELRLELLSDAAPGSGAGGPLVDREVVTDEHGLPVIPGRRLKGLLREACQEVHEAFALAGRQRWRDETLCSVDSLFGTPLQTGWVQIGDARLAGLGEGSSCADAARLAEWLTWAGSGNQQGWFRGPALLERFTVIRSQTAINPSTGAARAGALRNTRLLRRGLRFAGPVALLGADAESRERTQRTLALAAAALRRLGSARHRGPGRVKVGLWDSQAGNLTSAGLDALNVPREGKRRR